MSAAITDKLRIASGTGRPVVTGLSLPKAAGATTATLTDATGWDVTTACDVMIYRRQLNSTTGLYQEQSGTRTTWKALLTGTTLSSMVLRAGTEPTSGYAADGNTVVLAGPTAAWADDLVQALLQSMNQDGSLKSSAVQTSLGLGTAALNGWNALGFAPNTVTANGNHSYDLVFNGVDLTPTLSAGMRLRTTRTVAAPTQSTSLNGTNQYYSKTSPAGMTFTNNFVAGAWIKVSSYQAGQIFGRYDGTNGWLLFMNASGQIILQGNNASGGVFKNVTSYQSVPLNKWVHVSAQLDMTVTTNSPTTNYVMIDGVDVPAQQIAGGTPTSLVQGTGALTIGAQSGGTGFLFPGKIAQAFVSSAKITQPNVRTLYSQGLTSALITANSIISAYSFSNDITDLNTTNANNLTANGGALATATDAPWGQQADGTISSTLDYMIVQKTSFSTNTTITVQVPEGNTIPTSGGVSAVVYSSQAYPYGWPGISKVNACIFWNSNISSTATATGTQPGGANFTVNIPTGNKRYRLKAYTPALTTPGIGVIDLYWGSLNVSRLQTPTNNIAVYVESPPLVLPAGANSFSLSLWSTVAGTTTMNTSGVGAAGNFFSLEEI